MRAIPSCCSASTVRGSRGFSSCPRCRAATLGPAEHRLEIGIFARAARALGRPRRLLLAMRADRQPAAVRGNSSPIWAVLAAVSLSPVATGCDRSAPSMLHVADTVLTPINVGADSAGSAGCSRRRAQRLASRPPGRRRWPAVLLRRELQAAPEEGACCLHGRSSACRRIDVNGLPLGEEVACDLSLLTRPARAVLHIAKGGPGTRTRPSPGSPSRPQSGSRARTAAPSQTSPASGADRRPSSRASLQFL